MNHRELDAAELYDPLLRQAFTHCAELLDRNNHAAQAWTRSCLPAPRRPYWDAMIAFCGHGDDLADDARIGLDERQRRLLGFEREFWQALHGQSPGQEPGHERSETLLCMAFAHFARVWQIRDASLREAARALRNDMVVRGYDTVADVERYMYGVSGQPAIWLSTLLGGTDKRAQDAAVAWGYAMQTLDFLLDVEEDLRQGKVYLPLEDLRRCGLLREDFEDAVAARRMTEPVRELVGLQIARIQGYFAAAGPWERLVHPRGRAFVRRSTAEAQATVDRIAANGNDLFAPHEQGS